MNEMHQIHQPTRRRMLVAGLGFGSMVAISALAGCSMLDADDQKKSQPSPSGVQSSQPIRYEKRTGPGYEILVPSGWTEKTDASSKLTTKPIAWSQPGSEKNPVYIAVLIDDERKNDAEGQSKFLEVSAQATGKTEFKRTALEWPGARSAYLVEWIEKLPGSSGHARIVQLMAQRSDGVIVNAIGRAPVDQAQALDLHGTVRSLRLV